MRRLFHKCRLGVLGFLLHLANGYRRSAIKHAFYDNIKSPLLATHGRFVGYDYQEIIHECWDCGGPNGDRPCYHCGNTGIYERVIVQLECYRLGGFLFHQPVCRVYKHDITPTMFGLKKPSRMQALAAEAMVLLFLIYDRKSLDDAGPYTFSVRWKLPLTWLVCVFNRLRRPLYSYCEHCGKRYWARTGFRSYCSTGCYLEDSVNQACDELPF